MPKKRAFVISVPFVEEARKKSPDSKALEQVKKILEESDKKVTVISAGFLNRYNYQSTGSSLETAEQLASKDEAEYFDNFFKGTLSQIKHKRMFWDEKIGESTFIELRKFVSHLYANNKQFRKIVREIVDNFLGGVFKVTAPEKQRPIRKNIKNYVLEECAFTLFLREQCFEELVHIGGAKGAISWIAQQHFDNDFRIVSAEKFKKINDYKLALNYLIPDTTKKRGPTIDIKAGATALSTASIDSQAGATPQKKKSSFEKAYKGFFKNPHISYKEKAGVLSTIFKEFSNIKTHNSGSKPKEGCGDAPEASVGSTSCDSQISLFRPRADSI